MPSPFFLLSGQKALKEVLDTQRGDCDLIVALGHIPVAEATEIVRSVPEIDVFLTGHSHETTLDPKQVGETLILQAGAFGQFLGRLRLELDAETGDVLAARNALLPAKRSPVAVDRGIVRLVEVLVLSGILLLVCLL